MRRPAIKVCGLTRREDVRTAVELGAHAVGFVLCPSPRRVDARRLEALTVEVPESVEVLAVSLRPSPTELIELAGLRVDGLQADASWIASALGAPASDPTRRALEAFLRSGRFVVPVFPVAEDLEGRIARFETLAHGIALGRSVLGSVAVDRRRDERGDPVGSLDLDRVGRVGRGRDLLLAGGLSPENVGPAIRALLPSGVDVSSGIERAPGQKDPRAMHAFFDSVRSATSTHEPHERIQPELREILPTRPHGPGRFGPFGGAYVPEVLVPALERLEESVEQGLADPAFLEDLGRELRTWVGRPTPLTRARRLGERLGVELWLKREDLAHTGAHKINNALGQVMLAKRAGARRVVCETGAGQHGVATAAACARVGLPCRVFMGAVDVARQAANVRRMRLFGAEVVPVDAGQATLRAAVDEALREWARDPGATCYVIGSIVGPHPYPRLVRELQSVIGREAREQIVDATGGLPDQVVACVGGGSNAMGIFGAFLDDEAVRLVAAEGGGRGDGLGDHAATLAAGEPGILHGALSLFLQDRDGQIAETHSISAGLDYPGVGPELASLALAGRLERLVVSDAEALDGLSALCETEGILPALESAHAVAAAVHLARSSPGARLLVSCSGRGDKDLDLLEGLGQGSTEAGGAA